MISLPFARRVEEEGWRGEEGQEKQAMTWLKIKEEKLKWLMSMATQEKTLHIDITRWPTLKSDWLYFLQPRMEKTIQSAKTRPGADCGSDHELLIAKFRLKLKKVGKTTRLFRYDLTKIPYDYTVEVRNIFKGLDLIECLMNCGWRFVTLYRRSWSRPSSRKRNANQNYNVALPHTGQNGHHQKIYKQQMLERVWKRGMLLHCGDANSYNHCGE